MTGPNETAAAVSFRSCPDVGEIDVTADAGKLPIDRARIGGDQRATFRLVRKAAETRIDGKRARPHFTSPARA